MVKMIVVAHMCTGTGLLAQYFLEEGKTYRVHTTGILVLSGTSSGAIVFPAEVERVPFLKKEEATSNCV